MKTLLQLQELDLKIDAYREQELEIPKQKDRFEIHRKRLAAELDESENRRKRLALEQRECEKDIEQRQQQIAKYETQLLSVKKNAEYQSLLHEIEGLKKQIALKEERIIALMLEGDDAKVQFEEDKKRIEAELRGIEEESKRVDAALAEISRERADLESRREPMLSTIDPLLLNRYVRIRKAKKTGPAAVPMNGESCSGCYMRLTPQIVNEVLAGNTHVCRHCGRLIYHAERYAEAAGD